MNKHNSSDPLVLPMERDTAQLTGRLFNPRDK